LTRPGPPEDTMSKTAGGRTRVVEPDEVIDAEFRQTFETNDTGYDGVRGVAAVDPRALEAAVEGMGSRELLVYGGAALIAYGLWRYYTEK
jgi:hypothetical protein